MIHSGKGIRGSVIHISHPEYVENVHLSAPSVGTVKLANVSSAADTIHANVRRLDLSALTQRRKPPSPRLGE